MTEPQPVVPRVNWTVLIASAVLILGLALWAIVAPHQAGAALGAVVAWVASRFGWYYILTAAVVVAFVAYVGLSRMGTVKLGPERSTPTFGLFTWTAMLFAAGIGIDLMFFSVAEPVAQYLSPPTGEGMSTEAARQAIVWTLFHYGPVGWAMYAVMGGAFAFFAYRRGQPLSIRALMRPVFGRRADGWAGNTIDTIAVLGTVFGIATSLGIGVVQLAYGLHLLVGIPENIATYIWLITLSVAMATASTVSGVERGIRRLSEANMLVVFLMLGWVVVFGETRRILEGFVMNIGDFVSRFPSLLMDTHAWDRPDDWSQAWTLFFWAWWIAWAPFVGLFLARISRGRTLRQFIVGVMAIPFLYIALFVVVLGNSALEVVIGGDAAFGETAVVQPERAFFDLLAQFPGAGILLVVALVAGLLLYVTSADSGALVLASLSSKIEHSQQDGGKVLRVFWSIVTGLLTLGMLIVGGISALQQATLIIGVPFSVVLYLVMVSFFRALRREMGATPGPVHGPAQTEVSTFTAPAQESGVPR
ncbi:MAG TPA: BCCT family transporter [Arachnia sp.]|nr:BCCT family transporter [Arachnia sp.]HMT86938.1 BCCT family transporter [Arachnia sp.]